MALQVWLPLTQDARNQGLCGNLTTSNVTFTDGGKLGGKYLSAGTITIPAAVSKTFFNKTGMTFAFWIYPIGTSSSGAIMGQTAMSTGDNRMYTIFQYSTSNDLHLSWQDNTATNSATFLGGVWNGFFSADTWIHCCITYNGSKATIYRNGVQYATVSGISNRTSFEYNFPINGSSIRKLNDVRIYDTCLSPQEVKEIAKGLVLHYPLDSNTTYASLIDKTANYNVYNNYGVTASLTATGESYLGSPIRRLSMTPNSSYLSNFQGTLHSHGVYNWSRTFAASTKYVFWIYYKPVSHMDVRVGGTASNIGGWIEIPSKAVGDGWYVVGQYRNGSVTEAKIDNIFVSFYCPSATVNTPIQIDFACPTLVQGLTEIQPAINYGSGTIVYDLSGFDHNGDITGTWYSVNDTPKYKQAIHMSSTSSKIHISNFPTSQFGNSYTFAWWGKRNSNAPMFWGFSDGIRLNGMYTGTLWNTGDSSNNPIYKPGTTTTITAPSVNVWHHYAMVGDGSTCKLYIDGELYGQAKTYKAISGTSIYINGWDTSTTYCSDNTDISDFRIYATALSADDIKSLYQNEAYTDSSGNVYGAVH